MFGKKSALDHYFMQMYEELSIGPYSLYFYLQFSKEIIKHAESFHPIMDECLEIMRNTLKNISDSDIEMFLYYNPDISI
mgnify:CR=1 FL=1